MRDGHSHGRYGLVDREWLEELNRLYARLAEHLAAGINSMVSSAMRGIPPGEASQLSSTEACYRMLGLPPDAPWEQVQRRYRELARRLHPDVAGPETEHLFRMVTAAYEGIKRQRGEDEVRGP
jgi:hypothetical protein